MSKIDHEKIKNNIEADIKDGVYQYFPVLKKRLEKLLGKLDLLMRLQNPDPLLDWDMQLLIENDYI